MGGKRENSPKWIVLPLASLPSTTTLKTFSSLEADCSGVNSNVNFFQELETPVIVLDANVVPRLDFSEAVKEPEKESDFA